MTKEELSYRYDVAMTEVHLLLEQWRGMAYRPMQLLRGPEDVVALALVTFQIRWYFALMDNITDLLDYAVPMLSSQLATIWGFA